MLVDVVSHWRVATPNDLVMNFLKRHEAKPGLTVGTFWKTWLQPDFNRRGFVNRALAWFIGNDIMKVRKSQDAISFMR